MAVLFDDTYHGPRWRYGLQHRPISSYIIGMGDDPLPRPILFSHRASKDPRFPHGEADWPCEIPPDVSEHHGLVLVEAPVLLDPVAYDRHLANGGSEPD